jgi:hypothetical protein
MIPAWSSINPITSVGLLVLTLVVVLGIASRAKRIVPGRFEFSATSTAGEKTKPPKISRSSPYAYAFPPSRRAALAQLLPNSKVSAVDLSPEELRAKQLPTTKAQDLNRQDQHTPTGISTQEIKKLARFPDYATLSGVRHPVPDPSFDIRTAKFRPFRPFRWTYHQTMGK